MSEATDRESSLSFTVVPETRGGTFGLFRCRDNHVPVPDYQTEQKQGD